MKVINQLNKKEDIYHHYMDKESIEIYPLKIQESLKLNLVS